MRIKENFDGQVVSLVLILNVLIFLLWTFPFPHQKNFMEKNFLVSWEALLAGRVWTLTTSTFSHFNFLHLFLNLYVFLSFGSVMEIFLGSRRFLFFFLGSGIFSSLSHCLVSLLLLRDPDLPALGASGAISALILLFALLFPKEKIFFFGLIPIPAIWGAVLLVSLDLRGLFLQSIGNEIPIGYGAHLGGALFAYLYFLFLKRLEGSL